MRGITRRNWFFMRAFAEAWPEESIGQQAVAQLPWGHNVRLLDMVKKPAERLWYTEQAIQHGWSRNVLVLQIESRLYRRQGKAITNFRATLPKPQSDLAQQLLKDPYNFDFLTLSQEAQEKGLESGLVQHIRKFLLELGVGFAFVGSQYPLEVGGDEFRIDLLFYHLKLRCYVVVELKAGDFKPEHTGQLSFYLSAVDTHMKSQQDNPTIGLLLCKSQNRVVAEYALRDSNKPIGVAEYQLVEALPAELQTSLPSIEQIEQELGGAEVA